MAGRVRVSDWPDQRFSPDPAPAQLILIHLTRHGSSRPRERGGMNRSQSGVATNIVSGMALGMSARR